MIREGKSSGEQSVPEFIVAQGLCRSRYYLDSRLGFNASHELTKFVTNISKDVYDALELAASLRSNQMSPLLHDNLRDFQFPLKNSAQ
jgi:hypothetical protein